MSRPGSGLAEVARRWLAWEAPPAGDPAAETATPGLPADILADPTRPGDTTGTDAGLGTPAGDVSGGLSEGLSDPLAAVETELAPALAALLDASATRVVFILLALAALAFSLALAQQRLTGEPDSPSPGPPALAAALACLGLYLFGRLVDPLLRSLLERPDWFPAASWTEVGWFEWKLLGRPWAWGALPLSDHPTLALVVHSFVWVGLFALLRLLVMRIWTSELRFSEARGPGGQLPWFYRWVGSSTTRGADPRFRRWLGGALTVLMPVHALAGLRVAELPGSSPAPGLWVSAGLLAWVTAFHLAVRGKPARARKEDEQEDAAPASDPARAGPPLARLRAALETLRPGIELEPLESHPARAETRAEFPPATAPLVREIFEDLTGQRAPWAHQAAYLAHLSELWSMRAGPEHEGVPTLHEERATPVVQAGESSTPHALVLAPEGTGRTTLGLLAALHVYFERGATSLILVRDDAAAGRWAKLIERALVGSSARWNLLACTAGRDLAASLVAGRTPAVIVAALERGESELLCDPRTDDFLARLGLVVTDDVDGFTGVAEMHLQLCMRRLWALLDRLHAAPYPATLLATAGAGASGMDAWAKHVLAVPLRLFAGDDAPARPRVLLRRRDLIDGSGADLPLRVLAEACERAELPWHLRLAGDSERGVRRADFDLGELRHHHRDDPGEAAVVLVEGTYVDVRREAARLIHAGVRLDPSRSTPSRSTPSLGADDPVVLVLAPPGDEEMVLHEEAEDAAHRELIASLPRAVALAEPRVVRQRHFDRALGREQDLEALRERFGPRFVDETVAKLAGVLRVREVLQLDPRRDAVLPRSLVRTVREGALGQPIDAACVGEADGRAAIVDAGTSERLLSIDRAVAQAVYPPGRVFLHPRGRFAVGEGAMVDGDGGPATLTAEQIGGRERSTLDRSLALELAEAPDWTERQFGGRPLAVALVHGDIHEQIHGVRRFAPGPTLVDHRSYDRPVLVRYGSDACLVAMGSDPRGGAGEPTEPSRELLIPLVAALRMVLPGYLRAATQLVDVDLVELEGRPTLCFFDRTPGASGFARFICERGLKQLLVLARLVLERLVGPEFVRLRHIHDRAPQSDPARWRIGDALRWLDAVLDAPPQALADADEDRGEATLGGRRVEYSPGEGAGDLGRLWISSSGRSDDLIWTRHAWSSPIPLAGQPRGRMFFDVAIERPAIAAARRRALALAGPGLSRRERLDFDSSEAHEQLLACDRDELAPVRERLALLCGPALVDAVLGLVAAIPVSPRPLSVADRGPLAVFARRRADLDAKLLLACALLPSEVGAEIVAAPPEHTGADAWLHLPGGQGEGEGSRSWDLTGPHPRRVAEEPARRSTVLLAGA